MFSGIIERDQCRDVMKWVKRPFFLTYDQKQTYIRCSHFAMETLLECTDLVTITEEILSKKLHFCAVTSTTSYERLMNVHVRS